MPLEVRSMMRRIFATSKDGSTGSRPICSMASGTKNSSDISSAPAGEVPATGSIDAIGPGVLGPDEELVVREYIVRRRPQTVEIEPEMRLRPGSIVPRYVELDPMIDVPDPRLRRYASFVSPDNKVVVVDPATRVVVRILDR